MTSKQKISITIGISTLLLVIGLFSIIRNSKELNTVNALRNQTGKELPNILLNKDRNLSLFLTSNYTKDLEVKADKIKCGSDPDCNNFKDAIKLANENYKNQGKFYSLSNLKTHDNLIKELITRKVISNLFLKKEYLEFQENFKNYSLTTLELYNLRGDTEENNLSLQLAKYNKDAENTSYTDYTDNKKYIIRSSEKSKLIFNRFLKGYDLDCANFFTRDICPVTREDISSLILENDLIIEESKTDYKAKTDKLQKIILKEDIYDKLLR